MAPPSYVSALTGDFMGVPPSPKRPREDEQPEVRRTAQSLAWPWPDSNNVTIDIRSVVVSVRLHRGTGNRGARRGSIAPRYFPPPSSYSGTLSSYRGSIGPRG
eukprot:scaffold10735_cov124-Isochrysis_galbana.AAC.4